MCTAEHLAQASCPGLTLSDSSPREYYFKVLDGTLYGLKVATLDEWNMKKNIYNKERHRRKFLCKARVKLIKIKLSWLFCMYILPTLF